MMRIIRRHIQFILNKFSLKTRNFNTITICIQMFSSFKKKISRKQYEINFDYNSIKKKYKMFLDLGLH